MVQKNCYPISPFPACAKILHKYVNDQLSVHFGHLIAKEQYGFAKHWPTAVNLLDLTNFVKFTLFT